MMNTEWEALEAAASTAWPDHTPDITLTQRSDGTVHVAIVSPTGELDATARTKEAALSLLTTSVDGADPYTLKLQGLRSDAEKRLAAAQESAAKAQAEITRIDAALGRP